jgi:hypothetical protein
MQPMCAIWTATNLPPCAAAFAKDRAIEGLLSQRSDLWV